MSSGSGSGSACGYLVVRENGNASGGVGRAAAAPGQRLLRVGWARFRGKDKREAGNGPRSFPKTRRRATFSQCRLGFRCGRVAMLGACAGKPWGFSPFVSLVSPLRPFQRRLLSYPWPGLKRGREMNFLKAKVEQGGERNLCSLLDCVVPGERWHSGNKLQLKVF